jgi:hypothetical protein
MLEVACNAIALTAAAWLVAIRELLCPLMFRWLDMLVWRGSGFCRAVRRGSLTRCPPVPARTGEGAVSQTRYTLYTRYTAGQGHNLGAIRAEV